MKLALSDRQVQKAGRGYPIQLKHAQLGQGYDFSHLHPEVLKKIHMAHKKGKGVRLHLSQDELMKGQGIKEFFQKLKKGAQKIIDSDFYQKNVRPIARELVNQAIDLNPLPQKDLQKKVARKLGDKTKAFGVYVPAVQAPAAQQYDSPQLGPEGSGLGEAPKRKRGRPKKMIGSSFLPA